MKLGDGKNEFKGMTTGSINYRSDQECAIRSTVIMNLKVYVHGGTLVRGG